MLPLLLEGEAYIDKFSKMMICLQKSARAISSLLGFFLFFFFCLGKMVYAYNVDSFNMCII